jgi:hypothetical protein
MSIPGRERGIAVEEVRLIADLRIMHDKVHELFEIVTVLKRGHEESSTRKYADHTMLEKDIQHVDDIVPLVPYSEGRRHSAKKKIASRPLDL